MDVSSRQMIVFCSSIGRVIATSCATMQFVSETRAAMWQSSQTTLSLIRASLVT